MTFSKLSDLLFPTRCLACCSFLDRGSSRGQDRVFCPRCLGGFPWADPAGRGFRSFPEFSGSLHRVWALGFYEGVWAEAIHRMKYGRDERPGERLGHWVARAGGAFFEGPWRRYDRILPVPLHSRRLRRRGFNQSWTLVRILAGCSGSSDRTDPFVLHRHQKTPPQTGLSRPERFRNVRGSFDARGAVFGEKILLVDDVMTTGATLKECGRVLRRCGAERVEGLVLARTR